MNEQREATIEQLVRRASRHLDDAVLLSPKTPLLAQELLDSIELMELIAALEEGFAVSIPLEELTPENFASIRRIARLVARIEAVDD